jgi:two-component system sensor histidine kinase KdpD
VALVDELAHTNVAGATHEKRWQDVEQLLEAGISVITTVNVQHIESLNDKIAQLTGVLVRETVPDRVFTEANDVVIVDLAPESLQERLRRGEIYPAERVEQALQNFFRTANLSALRELALLQVAEEADKDVAAYRREAQIAEVWGVQERVLVGISADRSSALLIRRAVRLARRSQGKCYVVFVAPPGGLGALAPEAREVVAIDLTLARTLDTETHVITGKDTAKTLVAFAREHQVTQIFLGRSRKSRWQEWLYGSLLADVARYASGIDLHIVADR